MSGHSDTTDCREKIHFLARGGDRALARTETAAASKVNAFGPHRPLQLRLIAELERIQRVEASHSAPRQLTDRRDAVAKRRRAASSQSRRQLQVFVTRRPADDTTRASEPDTRDPQHGGLDVLGRERSVMLHAMVREDRACALEVRQGAPKVHLELTGADTTVATELMVPSLRALSRLGPDVEAMARESGLGVLERHGLPFDDFSSVGQRIPHRAALALLDNAVQVSGQPAFALHAGGAIERGDLGLFDLLAASAPTLLECMQLVARYVPLVHGGAVIEIEDVADRLVWKHRIAPGLATSAAANEYSIAALHKSAQRMLGFESAPLEIWMMHEPPPYHAYYREFFQAPVHFGCEFNAIVSPGASRNLPLAAADGTLLRVLRQYAEELLPRVPFAAPFAQRVREQVRAQLERGATLSAVARALHISQSNLQRRLQQAGTSYTELVDHARRDQALVLLANLELNMSEIAFALGFAHRTAFHRAFQRWYGHSPSEHRRRLAHSEFYRFYRGAQTDSEP